MPHSIIHSPNRRVGTAHHFTFITACAALPILCHSALPALAAPPVRFSDRQVARILRHSPLPPPPPSPTNRFADDPAAAHLGQYLFFDTRLSVNNIISCATCHASDLGLADGKPLANTIAELTRHTPAIWNVAYNRWFLWDGRADSLWSQALGPIEHPSEMGATRLACAHLVHADPALRTAYEIIFGPLPDLSDPARFPQSARPIPDDPGHPHHVAWLSMTEGDQHAVNRVFSNLGKAIAAYERKLLSTDSPFDRFARALRDGRPGDATDMSPIAQRGLKLFIGRANCRLCHTGPNFTDNEFHNTRVPTRAGGKPLDPGRYRGIRLLRASIFNAAGPFSDLRRVPPGRRVGDAERVERGDADDAVVAAPHPNLDFLTENPDQWGQFKTPSLRNVAKNPPYMHQGQFLTLRDVLGFYSTLDNALPAGHHPQERLLVALNLAAEETDALLAFLESLTDESLDPSLFRQPASPVLPAHDLVEEADR